MIKYKIKLTWIQKIAAFFSKKKKDRYEQIGLLKYCITLMNKAYHKLIYINLHADQYLMSCYICNKINDSIKFQKEIFSTLPIHLPHINCKHTWGWV